MDNGHVRFFGLATLACVAVTLQIMGCALFHNWWPMLQYIIFLLAPIPYVFLSPSSIFEMATAPATTGWEDVGKFLIGVAGVGAVAVPTMLLHLGVITAGAFIFEMAGLGCACAAGAIAAFAGGNQNDYFAL